MEKCTKILVTGSRAYREKTKLFQVLKKVCSEFPITAIVHGNASGADFLASEFAKENKLINKAYPADWDQFGTAAGKIRNQQMLDDNPDLSLAIAAPGGPGTLDMVARLEDAGFTLVLEAYRIRIFRKF